jgi:hypothetical protein
MANLYERFVTSPSLAVVIVVSSKTCDHAYYPNGFGSDEWSKRKLSKSMSTKCCMKKQTPKFIKIKTKFRFFKINNII